jgi:serine/threonine-protein kinase HipA
MSHLIVKLQDVAVGDLRRRSGDSWEFRFRDDYLNLHSRPILGQFFEDDPQRAYRANLRLPPFFSNLLPEGPLRQLVARHADINEQREALLLEVLGEDLPGAVLVVRGDGEMEENQGEEPVAPADTAEPERRLKFSLAGVQMKFSVLRGAEGQLTLPVTGRGGNWIVKLPSPQYPGVPANEYSMLQWARRAGIEVPDHELVPWAGIEGLPAEISFLETEALAIRRYDRTPAGRIHQEDFAQVLGLYPHAKYDEYNCETIGNIVHAVAGPEALIELARRLAFVVLSGNGDAHHKNWSLLYLDGRRASLTPAYDLVFTKAYLENDVLALKLGGHRRFEEITLESFRRLARKCGFDEGLLVTAVAEAVQRIRDAWVEVEPAVPMKPEAKKRLQRHLRTVRL